jgi:DNA-binding response OmpR family regulator
MFKCQEEQVSVLGVCIDEPRRQGRFEGIGFNEALSGRRAMDLLRMLSFDFLLVGTRLPDMSTWDFLRHLRTAHPQQKFALVGGPLTEQQEITARMFGATTIFDTTPTTNELLNVTARLRERAIATVVNGRFGHAAYAASRPAIAM